MSPSGSRTSLSTIAVLASAFALVLAGCGVGSDVNGPVPGVVSGASGIVHGGPNPVSGATVDLYATSSSGYGAAGTLLGSTTTGSNGSFSFSSVGTCTAGQQMYITSAGGNSGSGTNSNILLMAALGDCSNFSGKANIWIDEVTTVAAAYALDNFITISGSTVQISAPANNNAETPACTGTGSSMTCTAAGLKHAFLNGLNLANSVETSGSPNGQAYTVTPSNSSGSVPAALINSLANSIQACVNSTGGTAGDGSPCGNLFSYTTPPVTSPTAPANTLQAAMDVAKYPTLTAANVTSLYGLASASSFYQPALTAAPPDWSLAIVYSGVTVGTTTTAFGSPYYVALDPSDNVYVDTYASPTETVAAMTSDGTGIFANATSLGSTYTFARTLATDTAGNLWVANNSSSTPAAAILELSTADGSIKQTFAAPSPYYPDGIAIDRNNNVYFTLAGTGGDNLYTIPAGGTAATAVSPSGTAVSESPYPEAIAIDSSGNLWNTQYSKTATSSYFLPNTGSIASPTFGTAVTTTESSTLGYAEGIVFDSSTNTWLNNETTLYELATPPAVTPSQSLTIQSGSTSAYEAEFLAIDGANNIFLPDYHTNKSYLWQYNPATAGFVFMNPCAAPAGATSCNSGTAAGTYPALYNARAAQVDSTGSVWVASGGNDSVVQVLGVGTPAWPQLSYAKYGAAPQ